MENVGIGLSERILIGIVCMGLYVGNGRCSSKRMVSVMDRAGLILPMSAVMYTGAKTILGVVVCDEAWVHSCVKVPQGVSSWCEQQVLPKHRMGSERIHFFLSPAEDSGMSLYSMARHRAIFLSTDSVRAIMNKLYASNSALNQEQLASRAGGYSEALEVFIRHEEGHVDAYIPGISHPVVRDVSLLASGSAAYGALASRFYRRSSGGVRSGIASLGRSIVRGVGATGVCMAPWVIASHYREWSADTFALEHTKSAAPLSAAAEYFLDASSYTPEKSCVRTVCEDTVHDIRHPSAFLRSKRFNMAAERRERVSSLSSTETP